MSYAYLGQTPAPAETPGSPFADWVLFGGVAGGFLVLLVGGVVGQNRLWTQHILKRNRRRRRAS